MKPRTRIVRVAWLVAVVALLVYSVGHGSAAGPERSRRAAKPAKHTVTIDAVQFQPSVVEVKRGDSIIWINKDPFPHTVTSKPGNFDSQQIQPGESWTYRVQQSGDVPYVCTLHPTMKATIRVK
jgi:plastocyanin